jgi:hypothetical protein
VKNPNSFTTNFLRRIVFIFRIASRVFPPSSLSSMADAGGLHLNISAQMEKRGHGCPRGSKN